MPIDPAIAARFAPYLMPNETLLWTGHPPYGFKIMPADMKLLPYGVLILGYGVFFMIRSSDRGYDRLFVTLFLVVLTIMGVLAFVARLIRGIGVRGRTAYAITDQHALIMTDGKGRSCVSIPRASIGAMLVEQKKGWRGNLFFLDHTLAQGLSIIPNMGKPTPLAFEGIEDPVAVRGILLSASDARLSPTMKAQSS